MCFSTQKGSIFSGTFVIKENHRRKIILNLSRHYSILSLPLKWQIIYDGGKTTPISTTATSTKKLPKMLLSPNEDLAFTNSFSIRRGPPTYKSSRKDADLHRHTSFSGALQRLIFPDSNNEYGISSINNAIPLLVITLLQKNNTRLCAHTMTSMQMMASART